MRSKLVLWGFHPAYCDGQPIKLAESGAPRKRRWREKMGWTCAVYAAGEEPVGLRAQAAMREVNNEQRGEKS